MSVTQIQQMIHISSHIGQVCTCYWSFSSIIDCLMQKAKPKLDSVPKEAFESSLNGLNFTKPALFIFTLLYHVSCYLVFYYFMTHMQKMSQECYLFKIFKHDIPQTHTQHKLFKYTRLLFFTILLPPKRLKINTVSQISTWKGLITLVPNSLIIPKMDYSFLFCQNDSSLNAFISY